MYRLHFDPKTAMWVIQFLRFGVFWVTVKGHATLDKQAVGPKQFETLEGAESFVNERGINKAYKRKSSSFFSSVLNGFAEPEYKVREKARHHPHQYAGMEVQA